MFGMGTGVTPLPWLPSKNEYIIGDSFCKEVKRFFLKKVYFFTKGLKVYFGIEKNEMGKKKAWLLPTFPRMQYHRRWRA